MKNKEIDMKGASELLGVSYGTLYGRYTLYFGGLKQTVKPVKVDLVVQTIFYLLSLGAGHSRE